MNYNRKNPKSDRTRGGECYKCGKDGHMSRNCPQGSSGEAKCYNCGGEGHKRGQCKLGAEGGSGGGGKCYKCGKDGHKMDACTKGGDGGEGKCYKCGRYGHKRDACPKGGDEEVKRYKCGKDGHKMDVCPKGRGIGEGKCYKCGRDGHKMDACPKGESGGVGKCYTCGKDGHKMDVCPKGAGDGKGKCYTCGKDGHKMDACPKGGGSGEGKCYKCGRDGHKMDACPKGDGGGIGKCYLCGKDGHKMDACPKGGGSGEGKCYTCGKDGHKMDACPKGGSGGEGKCYKCGKDGHKMDGCPKGDSGGGGKCYTCGKDGHKMDACPKGGGSGEGKCYNCGRDGHKMDQCSKGGKGGAVRESPQGSDGGSVRGKCYKCEGYDHRMDECPTGKCYNCGEEGHKRDACLKGAGGGRSTIINTTININRDSPKVAITINIEKLTMGLGIRKEESRRFLSLLGEDRTNEEYLEKLVNITRENKLQLPSVDKMTRSTCLVSYTGQHGLRWIGTGFLATLPVFNGAVLLSAGHNFEDGGKLLDDYDNFNVIFNNVPGILKDEKDTEIIYKKLSKFMSEFSSSTVVVTCKGEQLIKKLNQPAIWKQNTSELLDYFALIMYGEDAQHILKKNHLELLEVACEEELKRVGESVFIVGHPGLEECICCKRSSSCSCGKPYCLCHKNCDCGQNTPPCKCRPHPCHHSSCSCRHPLRFSYAKSKKNLKVEDRIEYDLDTLPGNSGSPITGSEYKVKGIHITATKKRNAAQSLRAVIEDLQTSNLLVNY